MAEIGEVDHADVNKLKFEPEKSKSSSNKKRKTSTLKSDD
jgi:hypothetical protein